jgi:hypothetical protein
MPVTARLSRNFYDRFGDDVANELVEWFNSVDATYRADLRGINELNFSRFDARMAERLAKVDARFDGLDKRFIALESRFDDKIELRLAQFESRLSWRMFAFYSGQTLGLAALIYGMLRGR